MAKSSRRKPGRTDAQTAADVQNDLPEPDESALEDIEVDEDDLASADPDNDELDEDVDADEDVDEVEDLDDESDDELADDESDEDLEDDELDEDLEDGDEEVTATKKDKARKNAKSDKKPTKDDRKKKAAARPPSGGPVRFVRESVAELSKVVWPTRKQMITYTIVVLVFVVFLVAAIGFYDVGISKLMMVIFG